MILMASLVFTGCAQLVTEHPAKPRFSPSASADAGLRRAEQAIVDGRKLEAREPVAAIGAYLSAVEAATVRLQRDPKDGVALHDYQFALSRVFAVIRERHVDPWTKPLQVSAAQGAYTLTVRHDPRKLWQPGDYDFMPVDDVAIGGTDFKKPVRVEGLGAPLVAIRRKPLPDAEKLFLESGKIYYGVTAVARFENKRCVLTFEDPLATTSVSMGGHTFPLAADFSTSTAMLLADERLDRLGMSRLFNPGKYEQTARISRLQPYDRKKIPVLFIHGLDSTPETWIGMFNALRADPEIRQRYQFWFYSYPSGDPYFYPAMVLRRELDEIEKAFPHERRMVVIGHSMGSMIARLLVTDSGDKIWYDYFKTSPTNTPLSAEDRQLLEGCLIFKHRPEIGRVIFISGPHRGSDLASDWFGRAFSHLVHLPTKLAALGVHAGALVTGNKAQQHLWKMPNSIDTLSPSNRFVQAVNTIPLTPGIRFNQIMGDRGRGDTPKSSDGVVAYWSSHLDGAESELIVPSGHPAHENPKAIVEVRRILKRHLRNEN